MGPKVLFRNKHIIAKRVSQNPDQFKISAFDRKNLLLRSGFCCVPKKIRLIKSSSNRHGLEPGLACPTDCGLKTAPLEFGVFRLLFKMS